MRFSLGILLLLTTLCTGCGTPSFLITPVANTNRLKEVEAMPGKGWRPGKIAIIEVEGMLANVRSGGFLQPTENKVSLFVQELNTAANDPDVKAVYIDGHTDGGKAGEADLDLSRRRAEVVEDYFVERRIPKERLVVRYHADRYPIAPNTTAEGRAKNRRATIRLDYEPAKSAVARR